VLIPLRARPRTPCYAWRKAEARMPKRIIVTTGTRTSILKCYDIAQSATEALQLARTHMRMRRPNLIIEDEHGNSISLFELKDMAEAENGKQNDNRT
jgi:hypothetical protein